MWRGVLVGLLILQLFGCADFAASTALNDAKARCVREGKRFVQENVEKTELLVVSSARVSGHCAGPGEPGYVSTK